MEESTKKRATFSSYTSAVKCTKKRAIFAGVTFFLLAAVAAGLAIYYEFYYYENAEKTESTQMFSLAELENFAFVQNLVDGVNASIVFESKTRFDSNVSDLYYFVNLTFVSQSQIRSANLRRTRAADEIDTFFFSSNEIPISYSLLDLQQSVEDGQVEKYDLDFGAIGSYYFQVEVDTLTGFAFGSSREDEVLENRCFLFGSRCAGTNGLPSASPTTGLPTDSPSTSPTVMDSQFPSKIHSSSPTIKETTEPSRWPTQFPRSSPSTIPTQFHSSTPSKNPSEAPSKNPVANPSALPTGSPSSLPTYTPSAKPSVTPSRFPSNAPTETPSERPSSAPSLTPSMNPTLRPSVLPTYSPTISRKPIFTENPSVMPSLSSSPTTSNVPSYYPSDMPSETPTQSPTHSPSYFPSIQKSEAPTTNPTEHPSIAPSNLSSQAPTTSSKPSSKPSNLRSQLPSLSLEPSTLPTYYSSDSPTFLPTPHPTSRPSDEPSIFPSNKITSSPSTLPTRTPTKTPTRFPTKAPTRPPSPFPTKSPTDPGGIPTPTIFATSVIESKDYPTSGTINFWRRYTVDIFTGTITSFVSFEFVNIDPPNAPGAKLYLTPSESGKKINDNGVIPLDIVQADNGWYTIIGTFEQAAPSNYNDSDPQFYSRIILWCEPFDVYIGEGDIIYT